MSGLALEEAWQTDIAGRYEAAEFAFDQWDRVSASAAPKCLLQPSQTCSAVDLEAALVYIEKRRLTLAREAMRLLLRTRTAFMYAGLSSQPPLPDPFTDHMTTALQTSEFQATVTAVDAAWAQLQRRLGDQGNSMRVNFEFRRTDHPLAFEVLERTGILRVPVPWPLDPRERRARLLNEDVRAFFLGVGGGRSINTRIIKGNFSVFYNLNDDTPITRFPTSLSNFIADHEYITDTCETVKGTCEDASCDPDSYMTVSPYGDWIIKAEARSASDVVAPHVAFTNVSAVRLIFHLWYYSSAHGGDDVSLFPSNPCGMLCVLSPSQLTDGSLCKNNSPEYPTNGSTVQTTKPPTTSPSRLPPQLPTSYPDGAHRFSCIDGSCTAHLNGIYAADDCGNKCTVTRSQPGYTEVHNMSQITPNPDVTSRFSCIDGSCAAHPAGIYAVDDCNRQCDPNHDRDQNSLGKRSSSDLTTVDIGILVSSLSVAFVVIVVLIQYSKRKRTSSGSGDDEVPLVYINTQNEVGRLDAESDHDQISNPLPTLDVTV